MNNPSDPQTSIQVSMQTSALSSATDSTADLNYVEWFRHSSPYIKLHRGKTFVLMMPGEMLRQENFVGIVHDIALLNSLGVKLVLVHGARPQIETRLKEQGRKSQFHKHLRITDEASMTAIAQAIGEIRIQIEAALSTGLPNSPMHGAHLQAVSGNFVTAKPCGVIDGIDFQHTGSVRRVDTRAIRAALDSEALVVVSPLGYSPTGEIFNLSFADVATEVARALKADKLVSFIDADGIIDSSGALIRQLNLTECRQQLTQLAQQPAHGLRQALKACYSACAGGIARASIINYRSDGAFLKELFSRDGCGTMVYSDDYEQLRRANIDDVGGILELLEPLEIQGVLVRRSRELLETEIDRFWVMDKDGAAIACAALYPFTDDYIELACVVTHEGYQGGGRAAKLLRQLETEARKNGHQKLFVLTTQTAHWFIEQGFHETQLDDLPTARASLYNYQRNSKIFVKALG